MSRLYSQDLSGLRSVPQASQPEASAANDGATVETRPQVDGDAALAGQRIDHLGRIAAGRGERLQRTQRDGSFAIEGVEDL